MNTKIENLKDLFLEQSQELYSACHIEQREFPHIQNKATSLQLKIAIEQKKIISREQIKTLRKIFNQYSIEPISEGNKCYEAIFDHLNLLIERAGDTRVKDVAIINTVQRTCHNKIAGLGALAAYAEELGYDDIADVIHRSLAEEKTIDADLTQMALADINRRAIPALAM